MYIVAQVILAVVLLLIKIIYSEVLVVLEGRDMELKCAKSPRELNSLRVPTGALSFQWFDSNMTASNFPITDKGNLILSNVSVQDTGVFKCTVNVATPDHKEKTAILFERSFKFIVVSLPTLSALNYLKYEVRSCKPHNSSAEFVSESSSNRTQLHYISSSLCPEYSETTSLKSTPSSSLTTSTTKCKHQVAMRCMQTKNKYVNTYIIKTTVSFSDVILPEICALDCVKMNMMSQLLNGTKEIDEFVLLEVEKMSSLNNKVGLPTYLGSDPQRIEFTCAPARTYKYTSGVCVPCLSGEYGSEEGQRNVCITCPLNTFQPSYGSTECLVCPSDQFTEAAGSKSQRACKINPKGYIAKLRRYASKEFITQNLFFSTLWLCFFTMFMSIICVFRFVSYKRRMESKYRGYKRKGLNKMECEYKDIDESSLYSSVVTSDGENELFSKIDGKSSYSSWKPLTPQTTTKPRSSNQEHILIDIDNSQLGRSLIGIDTPNYNTTTAGNDSNFSANYNNNNSNNNNTFASDAEFFGDPLQTSTIHNEKGDDFRKFAGEMLTSTPMKLKSPNDLTRRIRNLASINERIKNISYKDANVVKES